MSDDYYPGLNNKYIKRSNGLGQIGQISGKSSHLWDPIYALDIFKYQMNYIEYFFVRHNE